MQRRELLQEDVREVRKEEVQALLGFGISDGQFEEAFGCARRKQQYIYDREARPATLQHWYLVKLTEEYVRRLAFSKFTLDLCRTMRDMEKEHSTKSQSAHTNTPIVASSAL